MPRLVDWSKDRVIIVHLGQRNTGGFSLEVQSFLKGLDLIGNLTVYENKPRRGVLTSQALTSPFLVLAVDRMIPDFRLKIVDNPNNLGPGPGILPPGGGIVLPMPPLRNGWAMYCVGSNGISRGNDLALLDSRESFSVWSARCMGNANAIRCDVNFSREQLYGFSLGRINGSFMISVTDVQIRRGVATIQYSLVPTLNGTNGGGCNPFALIRLDRSVQDVRLSRVD